jgi:hypothetical protein
MTAIPPLQSEALFWEEMQRGDSASTCNERRAAGCAVGAPAHNRHPAVIAPPHTTDDDTPLLIKVLSFRSAARSTTPGLCRVVTFCHCLSLHLHAPALIIMSAAAAPAAAHRRPRTRAVHQQGLSATLESFLKVSSSAAFVGCSRIGAHMLHQLLFLLGVALGVGRAESPCNAIPHAALQSHSFCSW